MEKEDFEIEGLDFMVCDFVSLSLLNVCSCGLILYRLILLMWPVSIRGPSALSQSENQRARPPAGRLALWHQRCFTFLWAENLDLLAVYCQSNKKHPCMLPVSQTWRLWWWHSCRMQSWRGAPPSIRLLFIILHLKVQSFKTWIKSLIALIADWKWPSFSSLNGCWWSWCD